MTVIELIKELERMEEHLVVVISHPDGIGWCNINKIDFDESTVKLIQEIEPLFSK